MKIIFIALCSIFILPGCAAAAFMLGVGTHIFEQNAGTDVQAVKEAGLNSIRDDFRWDAVEQKKGIFIIPQKLNDYLRMLVSESNVAPLMILDYGNDFYDKGKPVTREGIDAFANFARFSAKELSGKVNHFEIWNEWDHSKDKPVSAESYFELVRAAAPAIKSVNKNAVVLAGAATSFAMRNGWVERLVQLGVLNYADGISIHPYVHCDRDNRPEAWLDFVARFSARLKKANGGKDVPLYITETGWPSHNGACGILPEKAARYVARALLLVRTLPEVKGFWWYDLKNDGKNLEEREHNFGLLGYDYAPKPAFASLRDVAPIIINGRNFTRLRAPTGLVMVAISDDKGRKTFALWSESGEEIKVDISIARIQGASLYLQKAGAGKPGRIFLAPESMELKVDGTPQFLTGALNIIIEVK
jgi:hypothetical protein